MRPMPSPASSETACGACITGYLVDSLISTGRFEDARACLVLYPTEAERFVALGAIAESQGRRGSADAARDWIARDVPAGLSLGPLSPGQQRACSPPSATSVRTGPG